MQVSLEHQDGLERTLRIDVPAERIDSAVDDRLNELRKNVRLDGFRQGKVPYRVVRDRFGHQVRQEVLSEVIQSTLQEAVAEQALQPAGSPRIDTPELDGASGGVSYRATFEIYPEVALGPVAELEIERPVAEVTEADIDRMIERLQAQLRHFEDVDRPAQQGDQVIIDFEGRIDGEAFDNGSGQDTPVEIGANQMVAGFEEQLEGIRPGETRTLGVTFPDSYQVESLAGKAAQFEVTAKSVQAPQLPEVDEDCVRSFGIESGSVDELRAGLRRNMERELNQALRKQLKQQVLDALVEHNPIEVPQALVQEEIGRLREQMQQQLGGQMDAAQLGDDLFRDEAHRRARVGLILSELVQHTSAQADEESIRAQVQELASAYEDPQQVEQYYYQNQEMLQGVQAMVIEDKVIDWVLDNANVSECQSSFDEVVNGSPQQG